MVMIWLHLTLLLLVTRAGLAAALTVSTSYEVANIPTGQSSHSLPLQSYADETERRGVRGLVKRQGSSDRKGKGDDRQNKPEDGNRTETQNSDDREAETPEDSETATNDSGDADQSAQNQTNETQTGRDNLLDDCFGSDQSQLLRDICNGEECQENAPWCIVDVDKQSLACKPTNTIGWRLNKCSGLVYTGSRGGQNDDCELFPKPVDPSLEKDLYVGLTQTALGVAFPNISGLWHNPFDYLGSCASALYCDAKSEGICRPKLENSVACKSANQCTSHRCEPESEVCKPLNELPAPKTVVAMNIVIVLSAICAFLFVVVIVLLIRTRRSRAKTKLSKPSPSGDRGGSRGTWGGLTERMTNLRTSLQTRIHRSSRTSDNDSQEMPRASSPSSDTHQSVMLPPPPPPVVANYGYQVRDSPYDQRLAGTSAMHSAQLDLWRPQHPQPLPSEYYRNWQ